MNGKLKSVCHYVKSVSQAYNWRTQSLHINLTTEHPLRECSIRHRLWNFSTKTGGSCRSSSDGQLTRNMQTVHPKLQRITAYMIPCSHDLEFQPDYLTVSIHRFIKYTRRNKTRTIVHFSHQCSVCHRVEVYLWKNRRTVFFFSSPSWIYLTVIFRNGRENVKTWK